MNDTIWRGLAAAGATAGDAAVADARDRLAARVAADFPGLAVEASDDGVLLRAPGLVARAFGSRRRTGDPRLAGLVDDFRGGGR